MDRKDGGEKGPLLIMETTQSILIIDDSEADRTTYRRYLRQDLQQTYALSEADCAQAGLNLCRHQSFDVILLDFQLPDMSGLEVLNLIRSYYPATAVIMLTGYGDEQIAVKALKGGAQDYLTKGQLNKDTLQRIVRTVLAQRQLRQRLEKTEQQQQLITQMAFQIRHSLELSKTLESVVNAVRRLLQCDRVLAYQFAPDMSGQIIAESVGDGWPVTLGQTVEDTYFQKQGAEDYCQGRKQIVSNIYHAGLDSCHIKLLERFKVKAILVTPILMMGEHQVIDRLWGLIVAHQCATAREWQPDEIRMLETLSVHCAIAIQHAELLTVTQTALEKEKSLNDFKSQIIATVSHEYNSPLTAIQGAAALLRTHEQSLDNATRENLLNIILDKSKHMSALVKDMLSIHRSDLDGMNVKLTAINLEKFVTKLVAEQQFIAKQHHLRLKTRGNFENFSGDIGLIQQIFSNLLSNAVKYSSDGSEVQIYLIGGEQQIICTIKDQGIGISEKDQAHLFQAFHRGSNVGSIAGTGLGLKIVKTAVDLHNGTIDIHSKKGQGTHVKVCFPKQPISQPIRY
ncbi:MAG: ATP-binding protein [Cyanobacteria bacterium J06621_11]